jgi:hypothetical protein
MVKSTDNTEALFEPDSSRLIETNRVAEKIVLIELSSIDETNTHGHSFILGSSVNGVLGSPQLGEDGSQIVLGEAGRTRSTNSIVNPNNTFREFFRDAYFEDTGVTTADWSDTIGQLDFTTGEIAQSSSIVKGAGTIAQATFTLTVSSGSVTDLTVQLAADGSTFETVTLDTLHTFSTTGTDLRFKITAAGTVTVTDITISYVI